MLDEGVVEHDPTAREGEDGVNLLVLRQFEPALDVQVRISAQSFVLAFHGSSSTLPPGPAAHAQHPTPRC